MSISWKFFPGSRDPIFAVGRFVRFSVEDNNDGKTRDIRVLARFPAFDWLGVTRGELPLLLQSLS